MQGILVIPCPVSKGRRLVLPEDNGALCRTVRSPVLPGAGSPGSDLIGQRLFHRSVHLSAQFPRSIGRAGTGRQHGPHLRGVPELIAAARRPDFQPAEHFFRDGRHALGAERAEHDELIQPPHQLRTEPLFGFLHGLRRLFEMHGFSHPGYACVNAKRVFSITRKEQSIIASHMWPLTFRHVPTCREAVIVCLADKYCAVVESMFQRSRAGAVVDGSVDIDGEEW